MMYPYVTLEDETEVVHSQLIEGGETPKVLVHFERPTKRGFDSARCELPSRCAIRDRPHPHHARRPYVYLSPLQGNKEPDHRTSAVDTRSASPASACRR
ncbi:hypothetical protein B5F70_08890 [Collinsella sp. An268]|nr:hypothetical protein B5F70_08890 [Collinsella sp. An268]